MEIIAKFNNIKIMISSDCDLDLRGKLSNRYEIENGLHVKTDKSIKVIMDKKNYVCWREEESCLLFYVIKISEDVYNALNILIDVLIRRTLQEKNIYILHASSIAIENRNVILFGSSGSGKTATAIRLSLNKDVRFISNGSTVVSWNGETVTVLGTYKKGVKLRKSTLEQLEPNLCHELFDSNSKNNGYDCKTVLMPEEIGLRTCNKTEIFTNSIEFYVIQLEKTNYEIPYNNQYDYKKAMMLYEDLTKKITASDIYLLINGENVFVQSFDNKQI